MERWEVERIVREELERLLKVQFRFCPTCKEDVRMIEVDRGEGPTTWLCLGCLKQYKETLIPIVVPPQPPEEKTISPWYVERVMSIVTDHCRKRNVNEGCFWGWLGNKKFPQDEAHLTRERAQEIGESVEALLDEYAA